MKLEEVLKLFSKDATPKDFGMTERQFYFLKKHPEYLCDISKKQLFYLKKKNMI